MRAVFTFLFSCLALTLVAQRECATTTYIQQQQLSNPALAAKASGVESFVQRMSATGSVAVENGTASSIIYIPVVVHVLYANDAQNLSDAQIKSGIEALNRDFRRKNADSLNTPLRFKNIAADVQIEFQLAKSDARGVATSGIVRKKTSVTEWKMDDKIKFSNQGGDDAWDANSYLNIWVGNMRNLLGYASAPGDALNKDGIVISTTAFGVYDNGGPFSMGRTTVHEVGHWLGLKHIWGDTYCGDDGVADTPPQGNFTSGCPTGFRSSCNNGTNGDMYMNYMDFTNDACMNLFTEGQKMRMRALFEKGGPRHALLSSKGLNLPWLEEAPIVEKPKENIPSIKLSVYPNPVQSELQIDLSQNNSWNGKQLFLLSLNGAIMKTITINGNLQTIPLQTLRPGIYFLKGNNGSEVINQKIVKL